LVGIIELLIVICGQLVRRVVKVICTDLYAIVETTAEGGLSGSVNLQRHSEDLDLPRGLLYRPQMWP
jgi:hypothetical protein